jgi:hypothetical protein
MLVEVPSVDENVGLRGAVPVPVPGLLVVVAREKMGGFRVEMCVRKRGFQGGSEDIGLGRRDVVGNLWWCC